MGLGQSEFCRFIWLLLVLFLVLVSPGFSLFLWDKGCKPKWKALWILDLEAGRGVLGF